ncbi:hypothetical protein Tco_0738634 [Tanacetum coccineum]
MAFVSSPSSTNEVNTANVQVSTANSPVSIADSLDSTANLNDLEEMNLKWQLALLGMRARRVPRNQDNRNRNQDNSRRTVNVEETSSNAMVAIDGAGFDWSFMADEEVTTNMALIAFSDSEFNKSEFNLATDKRGLASIEEQLVFYKKNEIEKIKKAKESNQIKIDKFENASKSLDKLIGSQISDNSRKVVRFVSYNVVPPLPTGLFAPLTIDLSNSGLEEFQQPEFEGYGPKASKSVCKDTSNEVKKTPDAPLGEKLVSEKEKQTVFPTKIESVKQQEKPARKPIKLTAITIEGKGWNMTPREVLMKTGLNPLNTTRPVNTAHPKTTVYSARPMLCFSKLAQSTIKRPYQSRTLTNKNFNQKINTAKEKVYTAKPKAVNTAKPKSVNTARPTLAVVNAVRANQVNAIKASACWVWRPTKLNSASITFKRQNYIDAQGRSKSVMAWVPKGN